MTGRIEKALSKELGYAVAVFVRTESEVDAIAQHQPFPPAVVGASKGKLQVLMLAAKPNARVRKDVVAIATDEDLLAFGDRELYWLPERRDSRLSPRSEDDREAARFDDDAHQGHGRADCGEVLRRLQR